MSRGGMERGFGDFSARLKGNIDRKKLITTQESEFEIDTEEQEFWNCEEDNETVESVFKLEDIQKQVNLNCIKIEKNDDDSTESPFSLLQKDMVNLTDDGKVKKKVLREGDITTSIPEKGVVSLHYNSYVEMNEIPIDSSYLRREEPVMIQVGVGETVEGFEIAVMSMCVGEKSHFLVHPDLAYGKLGVPPRIPPDATIYFVIEVYKAMDCSKALEEVDALDDSQKTFAKICDRVEHLFVLAGEYFQLQDITSAINCYHMAEHLLVSCPPINEKEKETRICLFLRIYTNVAVCFNKLEKPGKACLAVKKAFDVDFMVAASRSKLWYQRGIAQEALGNLGEAMTDLKRALKLAPRDEYVNHRIRQLNDKMVIHEKLERAFSAKALGFKVPEAKKVLAREEEDMQEAWTSVLEDIAAGEDLETSVVCESRYLIWVKTECERLELVCDEGNETSGSGIVQHRLTIKKNVTSSNEKEEEIDSADRPVPSSEE